MPPKSAGRQTASPKARSRAPQTGLIATEDTTQEKLGDHFLGTLIIDIRRLDWVWSVEQGRNRTISDRLVRQLVSAFQHGIQRYSNRTRLTVTVRKEEFASILQSYIADGVTLEDVENRVKVSRGSEGSFIRYSGPVRPVLRNGQHRVEALLTLLEEQAKLAQQGANDQYGNVIQAPEVKDYCWAIDLYAIDDLDSNLLAALCANSKPVSLQNSEGYTAYYVISKWNVLSAEDQQKLTSSKTEFDSWLYQTFGITPDTTPRIKPILRNDAWKNSCFRYVSTRYGEATFNWALITRMLGTRLDFIWIAEFKKYFHFMSKILGGSENLLHKNDFMKIFSLPAGRPDFHLRLLFFPNTSDYWDGKTPHKRPFALPVEYRSNKALPKLSKPVHVGGANFEHRRPDFMDMLDEKQYVRIFHALRDNRDLECPSWSDWTQLEKHPVKPTCQLLKHILTWVEPTWKFPERANHALQYFHFTTEVKRLMLNEDTDTEIARQFILTILKEVKQETMWRDTVVETELKTLPTNLLDEGKNEDYLQRFTKTCWANIVNLVTHQKADCLRGDMAQFNNKTTLQDQLLPTPTWGNIIVDTNFRDNMMLLKTPALDNPLTRAAFADEGDVFGALIHYRELKRKMLLTLEWGYIIPLGKNSLRPKNLIASMEEYIAAAEVLVELDMALQKVGYNLDRDNFNEDLGSFTLRRDIARPVDTRPEKPGFQDARPLKYKTLEEEYLDEFKRARRQRMNMMVERSGTRKRKRGDPDPTLTTVRTILEMPIPVDIRQLDGNRIDADTHLQATNRIKQKCLEYVNMADETRATQGTQKWLELKDLYAYYKLQMPEDEMEDLEVEPTPGDDGAAGAETADVDQADQEMPN
ncbi:uncharacterized protein APUU_70170S [Aspergillus puulaauensis]|uniref:Uncharacterized protein n=1 Tax=Aspergillus puulaauensis TaxID=1220207 RepID=A0A7R7XUF7_9EURO|nr:uncharacterized protein APUU_60062S [Aspergillus puulaauensis]XP_041560786.1 uncharacterized protein APUU_70170S [Aspergillus puulaauensis]BCS27014.1 hypothetical protein APUU_60062S [Aspergillus puulaauensis]BCS28600.1 hypothetical protein APUU_70170S [Aspergillus puulaauensis]